MRTRYIFNYFDYNKQNALGPKEVVELVAASRRSSKKQKRTENMLSAAVNEFYSKLNVSTRNVVQAIAMLNSVTESPACAV